MMKLKRWGCNLIFEDYPREMSVLVFAKSMLEWLIDGWLVWLVIRLIAITYNYMLIFCLILNDASLLSVFSNNILDFYFDFNYMT
jgi:hypothetical protein